MVPIGKFLITAGLFLVIIGIVVWAIGHTPMGRLPGDIYVKRGNFTFYFPLATSIIISIVLSLLLMLFRR